MSDRNARGILKYFSSTSKRPKLDDGASDIDDVDNPLVSGLSAEGEGGNCEEMEVEADQSLVASYSDQETSSTGADKGIDSHDKVSAIELRSDQGSDNAGRMHAEADEQENDCLVLEASDINEQTAELVNDDCTSPDCCGNLSQPFQPKTGFDATKRKQGKQNRLFNSAWYRDFSWLTFCLSQQKAFCFYCRKAAATGILFSTTRADSTLITKGFNNWKKAQEKFRAHEKSQIHREACLKVSLAKQPSVTTQLSLQVARDQQWHREMLIKEISSLRYLLRQGLAIRGHKEEEGNLYQLLKCRSEDVGTLSKWLNDGRYLSHEVVNELIEIMAHKVLRQILSEIREAEWFAIIGDETRDVSGAEQFALSIRWVDCDYTVYEDLIGLIEVDKTDAVTLTGVIKDALLRMMIPLNQCRGQAFDGASNMAGHLNGVAARIIKESPKAHYVHCLAHSLNLCLQDCARACQTIKESLLLVSELSTLIRASPKRLALFKSIQQQFSVQAPGIKPLCPTRWTVRTGAIDSILQNYSAICESLEQISSEGYGEPAAKSLGLRSLMTKFAAFLGLKLSRLVFSPTEQLSVTLQSHDINAQQAVSATKATKEYLQRLRSDSAFEHFYKGVVADAENLTDEPTLPRRKKVPRRLDEGADNHQYSSPKYYFRQQYFEVLDVLINELTQRFSQPSFTFLQETEKLIIDSCNGLSPKMSENFKAVCDVDVDINKLAIELSMLPDVLKTANQEHKLGIKKVTTINTVCELFNTCTFAKSMLLNVHRLLRIYLTVPMTSATAERTFSALRRVKSYLRSTMGQSRLNHVIILNAHKQRTNELDICEVAKDFASKNSRREEYFGHF